MAGQRGRARLVRGGEAQAQLLGHGLGLLVLGDETDQEAHHLAEGLGRDGAVGRERRHDVGHRGAIGGLFRLAA